MKKVVNITIGTRVFSIEDSAYSILSKYLDTIGKHFKKEDSSGEIIQDIEDSISEKLFTKKRSLKNAVTDNDISDIIRELGTIEELTDGESLQENVTEKQVIEAVEVKNKKVLYRNSDNKILGGVCSGIADYFGIDPVITRVLFVILLFVNGIGFILYLVLWFIVPIAKTTSQKLAMKGESINLETIEDYFETKSKKKITNNLILFITQFLQSVFTLIQRIFPLLRIIFSSVIIFFSSIFIFLITTIFFSYWIPGIHFDIDNTTLEIITQISQMPYIDFLVLAVFNILFIPFFLLLIVGFALLLKRKVMGLGVTIFLFFIWMVSLSYTTLNIFANMDTIQEVAEILGEEIVEEGEGKFQIYIES